MPEEINTMEFSTLTCDRGSQALEEWQKAGISHAITINISGYANMVCNVELTPKRKGEPRKIRMPVWDNKIFCAASHLNIVNRLYWLNPHDCGHSGFQHMGSYVNSLDTKVKGDYIVWKNANIKGMPMPSTWDDVFLPESMPLLVNIDFTGFVKPSYTYGSEHRDTDYWPKVKLCAEFIEHLGKSKSPTLITIVRKSIDSAYVLQIQDALGAALNGI